MWNVLSENSLRERKKQQTREDLVRATLELFHEQGFEATTVDDIVARGNYSQSTFYRYFGTKEDVLFGDIPVRTESLRARLSMHGQTVTPWAVVRQALTEEIVEWTEEAPELQAACIRLWFSEPALRRRLADFSAEWEDIVTEFLQGASGGRANKVETRVMATAALCAARAVLESAVGGITDVRALLDQGFDLLETGFASLSAKTARPSKRPARV